MVENYLIWLLLAPFILSLMIFVFHWLKSPVLWVIESLHVLSITLVLILGLLVIQGVFNKGNVFALNEWFHVDTFAAVFLGIVVVIGFIVGIYSLGYIRNDLAVRELNERQIITYYGLFNLFLFTMLLVVVSNNIIMMWVAIEATTLGSAFLVGIYRHRSSLEAAWKYVIICTVGVAFGLYGTILVYSDAVNFLQEPKAASLWTEIVKSAQLMDPTLLKMAFVFVLIGFGTKAGIFPMHAWLPDAHSEAPSPVSAMLSAVLLNCALFVVIRFATLLNAGIGSAFTQTIFLVFGALSVIFASLFMFVQRDFKRLLAYSSVENIGLIVLGFGIGGPAGTFAALLHTVNHSLVKSLMFCSSGNVLIKYRSRDLGKIKGMIQAAPITSILVMVGALALIGSPPFNIFISKLIIFTAGIASGHVWLMIVCLLFLSVVFAAFMRFISSSVFGDLPLNIKKGDVKISMLAPVFVLMLLVIYLGLFLPSQYTDLLNQAAQVAVYSQQIASTTMSPFINVTALPVGIVQLTKFLAP